MENPRAPKDGDPDRKPADRRKPGSQQSGGSGGGSTGTPTPPWSLLFLIAAMVLVFLMWNPFKSEIRVSYYPWFLDQVNTDNIESITFQGRDVRGKLRTPDQEYKASDSAKATTVSQFTTTIPTEDALDRVMALLQGETVPATGEARSSPPPRIEVLEPQAPTTLLWLSFLLPMLLIGGLIFFMMRRARDQFDGGILGNFTKSQAKRHDKSKQRTTFDEVAGLENAKAELQEIVEFLKTPDKFQRLGGRIPKGVLLIGPPGSGKTLLARAVAGEAGAPFFSISGSEFIQMFVGVGASRVRDMFKTAKENSPCILFIDEIDAVGRVRGAGLGGGHDEREQTLNQILTEMDGFTPSETVIVLAATNRPDVLDPALLRPGRFDRHVTVDRPTRKGRFEILKVHTRNVPLADEVDLDSIARGSVGMSGADLANLVNEAALIATRENKDKVDMQDFEAARDKVMMGAKREEFITQKDKRATAYHEAGHALVAWMTPKTDPVHKVTIIPRGRSLGVTQFIPEEDRLGYSESQIKARLDVLLGGRAAEKLIYDDLSTGAAEDLKQATRLARMMVTQWGMSPRVGPVYVQGAEEHPFLGREMTEARDHSEHTQQVIDEEVARILREADTRAFRLLEENREQLERMTDALIEREVITDVEIQEMIGKRALDPSDPHPDEVVVSTDAQPGNLPSQTVDQNGAAG
ncbi:ATP-dependent zinc metalloprotease FtsH [Tautonia marina]|uniref:ATP-dependent zinc metalloprotease FtsH n=1 Tax=Tautonia marina TaxID=2653855 RepID=UPI0012604908|nr:ATP-dependent zinc metalloprotease FtsH [Tautonia marina]